MDFIRLVTSKLTDRKNNYLAFFCELCSQSWAGPGISEDAFVEMKKGGAQLVLS